MTTTLRLSALNQVSMALQMLQILSRAGAWWSGQPKSNTWETTEPNSQNEAELRSGQRAHRLIYLWIELTDVATLFTEVEELNENRQIKSINTLRKVCNAFQKLLLMRMFRQKQFTVRKKTLNVITEAILDSSSTTIIFICYLSRWDLLLMIKTSTCTVPHFTVPVSEGQ